MAYRWAAFLLTNMSSLQVTDVEPTCIAKYNFSFTSWRGFSNKICVHIFTAIRNLSSAHGKCVPRMVRLSFWKPAEQRSEKNKCFKSHFTFVQPLLCGMASGLVWAIPFLCLLSFTVRRLAFTLPLACNFLPFFISSLVFVSIYIGDFSYSDFLSVFYILDSP